MKLAVIGGGSTYTPELVDGLTRVGHDIGLTELVLQDPDSERLSIVGGFARRLLAAAGSTVKLVLTDQLEVALTDASIVLLQLRVGGQEARLGDETFPLACGCIGQETTGAGGLAKALRTVPVVLEIAALARRLALPDAWIVDFTNPVGIVTRALLDEGHRAVGLCNVAIGFQRKLSGWFEVAPDNVKLDHVGLNHLTWIRDVTINGSSVMDRVWQEHGDELARELKMPRSLLNRLGVIPSYYLRYYYLHDAVLQESLQSQPRAQEVLYIERELLRIYADESTDSKPALLSQRGGAYYSEAAIGLVRSLLVGDGGDHVCNVRNGSTLRGLPADTVIEVPCRVDADGATPLPLAPLSHQLVGLTAHVAAYEELAVSAAIRGGQGRVFDALLAHPLIGQYEAAEALTGSLLQGNRDYLPWLP